MQIYELIIVFLIGAGLGVTARYILGYKKKYALYVAVNILLGGAACLVCNIFWESNVYSIFLSGFGGVIFNALFCIWSLIFR